MQARVGNIAEFPGRSDIFFHGHGGPLARRILALAFVKQGKVVSDYATPLDCEERACVEYLLNMRDTSFAEIQEVYRLDRPVISIQASGYENLRLMCLGDACSSELLASTACRVGGGAPGGAGLVPRTIGQIFADHGLSIAASRATLALQITPPIAVLAAHGLWSRLPWCCLWRAEKRVLPQFPISLSQTGRGEPLLELLDDHRLTE